MPWLILPVLGDALLVDGWDLCLIRATLNSISAFPVVCRPCS